MDLGFESVLSRRPAILENQDSHLTLPQRVNHVVTQNFDTCDILVILNVSDQSFKMFEEELTIL
jgi:hypothetical protein